MSPKPSWVARELNNECDRTVPGRRLSAKVRVQHSCLPLVAMMPLGVPPLRSMRKPDELRGISADLLYELQMLFLTADRLRRHQNGDLVLPEDIKMACIESFAIHARVLEAFLWDSQRKAYPDDALATDFFESGEWETIRERVQRSALDDLRGRAGHEIAHLSYKRVNKPEAARRWKFDVIAGVIGNAFRLFLENVSPEFLCNDFEDRLRATWPHHLNHAIAMSFPPDSDALPAIAVASQSLLDISHIRQATFEEMIPRHRT
jgi:hypothetical protein